ncbi:hypothetical protein GCM10010464_04210 [Pseudonocardia yunnanensis]
MSNASQTRIGSRTLTVLTHSIRTSVAIYVAAAGGNAQPVRHEGSDLLVVAWVDGAEPRRDERRPSCACSGKERAVDGAEADPVEIVVGADDGKARVVEEPDRFDLTGGTPWHEQVDLIRADVHGRQEL